MIRGVSGGEKKRVTIGVEAVLNRQILFLDEPSTGLDSAAAYDVIKATRNLADSGVGVICALLQAGVELFGLFDTLLLLSHGEVTYFGPSKGALGYFSGLGLRCPPLKNPAEFLQELTDRPVKYLDKTAGAERPKITGPKDLVRAYKNSNFYEEVGKTLWKGIAPEEVINVVVDYGSKYAIPTWKQYIEICQRTRRVMSRDAKVVRTRMVRSIILGLLMGTLFWNLGKTQADTDNRFGLIFFCLAFSGMGALQAIPPLLEEREVFYHQRSTYYYRTKAYFFSTLTFEVPLAFFEILLFAVLVYFMTGLNNTAEAFFFFAAQMYAVKLASNSFCRMVSAVSPSLLVANALAPTGLALMFLMTGYLLPRDDIPDYWIWLYHISMFRYGLEGLAINEMIDADDFSCKDDEFIYCDEIGIKICPITTGKQVLEKYDMETEDENQKYLCLSMVFVFFALFSLGTYFALQYLRPSSGTSGNDPKIMFRKKKNPNLVGRRRADSLTQSEVGDSAPSRFVPPKVSDPMGYASLDASGDSSKQSLITRDQRSKSGSSGNRGAYMSFNNIRYAVDIQLDNPKPRDFLPGGKYFLKKVPVERKVILKGVSGYVKPGMLVSLMGPSGAGKSTLLDILANRKTGGYISGDLLINGQPRNEYFPRMSGYVEQQDIHLETQTVREAVIFSAMLRLPSDMSDEQKMRQVEDIIDEVGLRDYEDKVVGVPGSGLSPELRKKLNIAVELVSNPILLFLDEPTSGLDSGAAENIMRLIREVANRGRSVICTIHQPGVEIIQLFDWLLLLNGRGQQVYFGPMGEQCATVLGYFETLGAKCPPFKNPADFVLEVTGAGIDHREYEHIDAVKSFQESSFARDLESNLSAGVTPSGVTPPNYATIFAQPLGRQIAENLRRAFKSYARRPLVRRARNVRSIVMGIVIGSMFFDLSDDESGARNRVSLIFFCMLFAILGAVSSISLLISDRNVYYRERAAGYYRPISYFLASVIVELPFAFVSMMIYVLIMYFMVDFNYGDGGDRFGFFIITYYMVNVLAISFCQFVAAASPSAEVANGVAPIGMTTFALFSGFLLPKNSIPDGWIWMYYLSFIRYPLAAITINEVTGLEFECSKTIPGCPCPIETGEDILRQFDMPTEENEKWGLFLTMFAFYGAFLFGTYYSLAHVNHLRR
eukprot:TRINITY_DN521_c0_g2_i4.p1 TRINITY_DN521_c0_g2~~TRINITY_DN521_c0_g2_i4.p1  ORF type:complete len:1184 (-),score=287.33 TRINITY_DN521_c0_g2_i4:1637-5140(-)